MLDHSGRESCLGAKRPNLSPFWALRLRLRGFLMQKTGPTRFKDLVGPVFLFKSTPMTVAGGLQLIRTASEVLPSIRKTGRYSMKESNEGMTNTADKKLDEIMQQIQSIKAYLVTRDTAQVLVSREMMKQ